MKKIILLSFLLFVFKPISAQRFFSVVFQKLPQDLQLYPRDDNSEATVGIEGIIEEKDWSYMSVQVFRNNILIKYQKSVFNYAADGKAPFAFKDLKIKAELAQYDFKIYAVKLTDSVLIVNRKNVVAGDVFLLNGQSNAAAGYGDEKPHFQSDYVRTFGRLLDFNIEKQYNPADTLWSKNDVGKVGTELQRLLIENYKIPICIINQANGGASITFNSIRDENNLANLNSTYGTLYYRAKKAGVLDKIKGYVWRQGENESSGGATFWGDAFDKLYKYWRKDYPNIQKYYVFQVGLIDFPLYAAGQLRDYQRRTKNLYDRVENLTSVGVRGYDGIHYDLEGYKQSGYELYLMIARDFYGSKNTSNITAPNLEKVYFANAKKDAIVLQFEQGQEIVWQNDTTLVHKNGQVFKQYLKDMFFTELGVPISVESGRAAGNKVILQLNSVANFKVINYLPAYHTSDKTIQFGGPFIKNSKGMGAFSFHEVKIDDVPTPSTPLDAGAIFSRIPQNFQLFPRDEKNQAAVSILGKITKIDFDNVSLVVRRNDQRFSYQNQRLTYQNNQANFQFSQIIKAELANYDFTFYAIKGTDSVEIANRKKIVSGDVFVISGQSNSTAFFTEKATNEFCRTFGKITGNLNNDNYNAADTLWNYSNQDPYATGVGTLGFQFQKGITEKNNIPTCVINGGFHFSNMNVHAVRTATNPTDLTNGYGRMLYRIQKAGLQNSVKALIFRQGESEAYGEGGDWEVGFSKYYKNIKTDLPNLKQFYVFQIDIIAYPRTYAATLRDYQRRLSEIYPDVKNLATVGTKSFDGLHYKSEGYTQNAQELQRLVERDFYGLKDTTGINSPNLRKAFFNATKTEVTLTFDSDQKVILNETLTKNGTTFKLTDYFYLNDFGVISSAKAEGSRIVLKLKNPSNAVNISYLPSFVNENTLLSPYTGPYVTNQKGMRAFTFFEVNIGQSLVPTTLTSSLVFGPQIKLNWTAIANTDYYLLEKKSAKDSTFSSVILNKNLLAFTDTNIVAGTAYQYRIRGINAKAESDFALANITTPTPLATPVLVVTPTYFDAMKLIWSVIQNATKYILEKKNGATFEVIGNLSNQLEFSEKDLLPNTNYTYRIKAVNDFLASGYATIEAKTPALLPSPELTSVATYYNATKLNWKPVTGVSYYTLERQSTAETEFKLLEKLPTNTIEFLDKSLKDNMLYTYRLKAFGNLTESLISLSSVKIPAILGTPEVSAQATYNNAGTVKWQAVPNATSYTIERKIGGEAAFVFYKKVTENELVEKDLKVNTAYSYSVKAFNNLSESTTNGTAIFTTPDFLPTPQMTVSGVTHEALKLTWTANVLSKRFVILRKLKEETEFKKLTEVQTNEFTDTGLKDITSYTYQIQAFGDLSESLKGVLEATTLVILANESYSDFNLKITPNPAKENVSISLPDNFDGEVLLIDVLGKSIFSEKVKGKIAILLNISGMKQGIYLVILKSNKGNAVGKLVVE